MLPSLGQYVIIKNMDKKEEKEIEYLNSHLNRLWTCTVVLLSGLIGMSLSISFDHFLIKDFLKIILIVLGIILAWLMMTGIINTDYKINKKLQGDKNE